MVHQQSERRLHVAHSTIYIALGKDDGENRGVELQSVFKSYAEELP